MCESAVNLEFGSVEGQGQGRKTRISSTHYISGLERTFIQQPEVCQFLEGKEDDLENAAQILDN